MHQHQKPHAEQGREASRAQQATQGDAKPISQPSSDDTKITELTATLKRVQADFENYIKRAQREQEEHTRYASATLLEKLLPVLDSFEVAIKHTPQKTDGLAMLFAQLMSILEKEGLRPIETDGKPFDPYYHEVLLIEKGNEDKIIECLQKGYMLKDKVLRHAKVKIMKKNEPRETAASNDNRAETSRGQEEPEARHDTEGQP